MIPKIIHYCWLSKDPLPRSVQSYIDGWKAILPDYDFILWNFDRFDPKSSLWVTQAFAEKKYAFAADYIRLFALYHHGGIYMDTDVELIRSFNPFLQLNSMLCFEDFGDRLEMATFGVERHSSWVAEAMNYYDNRPFIKQDGSFDMKVVPKIVMEIFENNQLALETVANIQEASEAESQGKIPVFSSDFFSPKSYATGNVTTTVNTHSIHHFAGSWLPNYVKWEHAFWNFLGLNDPNLLTSLAKLKRKLLDVYKK